MQLSVVSHYRIVTYIFYFSKLGIVQCFVFFFVRSKVVYNMFEIEFKILEMRFF